jgi:hypothetical protein
MLKRTYLIYSSAVCLNQSYSSFSKVIGTLGSTLSHPEARVHSKGLITDEQVSQSGTAGSDRNNRAVWIDHITTIK